MERMDAPLSSQINFNNSYPLRDIPSPHPHDVLCGRGGGTNNHVGNSHWRMLVAANKQLYVTLPKRQKMLLSRSIVNAVRSQNPPGRFLQKDAKSDLWYDVGDQRAQEKTSQALREGAPDIRSKMQKGESKSTGNTAKTDMKKINASKPLESKSSSSTETAASHQVPQKKVLNPTGMMRQDPNTPFISPMTASHVAPPGSQPVMVYAMQGGVPGMPIYQGMMSPNGVMLPAVQTMPPLPPPVPAQVPSKQRKEVPEKRATSTSNNDQSMPPPSNSKIPHSSSSLLEIMEPGVVSNMKQEASTSISQGLTHNNVSNIGKDMEDAATMIQNLEPSGVSFGSISMTDFVGNGKLEPAGTSFGSCSMMSFTVGSKAPDMVDGGLEPIGTSFGSLSLNSGERNELNRALQYDNFGPSKKTTYSTPTLLSQQRSTDNLLDCSDTESEEDEEELALKKASKSAEWEKLKAILEAQTNMESKQMAPQQPVAQRQNAPFDVIPQTGFDRDFSNISAMSMGDYEDFDNLAPINQKADLTANFDADHAASIPPPLPIALTKQDSDDDSIGSQQRLQLMYLQRQGGAGLGVDYGL